MSGRRRPFAPPAPITADHDCSEFASGKAELDEWLRRRALANEGRASRTFVVEAASGERKGKVVAYYALAAGSVQRAQLSSRLRHDMPDPVPVMVLGRLAVDQGFQGQGLAKGMLKDAFARVIEVSRNAGVRMVVVHAIDADAAAFYRQFGFRSLPWEERTLFLPIETLVGAL